MRLGTIAMIGFAVLFGLLAVFIAQSWLNSQAEMRMKSLEANKKPIATRTLVVAGRSLRFGQELSASQLKEVPWPEEAVPPGAYATIQEMLSAGKRVVLTPIEPNEPVLATKITGSGQRATLSSLVGDGQKAVTIRVNDVEGVGGFVLPGDRVDVILTRQTDKGAAMSDVVLQNARVLAVDQTADERADKPTVVKTVTLEAETQAAQKLALAQTIGTLALMLRKAGEVNNEYTRRVTVSDLGTPSFPAAQRARDTSVTTIAVTRASTRQEYSVPVEGKQPRREAAAVGEKAPQQ